MDRVCPYGAKLIHAAVWVHHRSNRAVELTKCLAMLRYQDCWDWRASLTLLPTNLTVAAATSRYWVNLLDMAIQVIAIGNLVDILL